MRGTGVGQPGCAALQARRRAARPRALSPQRTQVGMPALGGIKPVQLALGVGGQKVEDGGAGGASALHCPLVPECLSIETALWVRSQLQLLHQLVWSHLDGTAEG